MKSLPVAQNIPNRVPFTSPAPCSARFDFGGVREFFSRTPFGTYNNNPIRGVCIFAKASPGRGRGGSLFLHCRGCGGLRSLSSTVGGAGVHSVTLWCPGSGGKNRREVHLGTSEPGARNPLPVVTGNASFWGGFQCSTAG